MNEQLLTAKQVQERLRVSPQTLWRLRASGALPHHKLGSSVRFHPDDVSKYVERTKIDKANLDKNPANSKFRSADINHMVEIAFGRAQKHNHQIVTGHKK